MEKPAASRRSEDQTTIGLDRKALLAQIAEEYNRRGHLSAKPVPQVDPAAPAPRFRVRVAHQKQVAEPKEYVFEQARVSFGRAPDNDVALNSPQRTLSRYHFEIQYEDRAFWLVDVHSRNATSVKGTRLQPAERYILLEGDSFQVGDFTVTFLGA